MDVMEKGWIAGDVCVGSGISKKMISGWVSDRCAECRVGDVLILISRFFNRSMGFCWVLRDGFLRASHHRFVASGFFFSGHIVGTLMNSGTRGGSGL